MALGIEAGLSPGDFVLDGDPAPSPKRGRSPPIFGPCLLRPNGCIDQDATWYGGRPRPRRHCVRWGPSPSPIFGPCLLWPNGWMHQDATWYGGTPRPKRQCVGWDPASPPLIGHSPQFSANVRCCQTAAWTKMPLGMEVGLGPGQFVFDGDPATPRKKEHIHFTQFLVNVYCFQTAEWMKTPLGTEVDLGPGHIVLDGVRALRERGTTHTPSFRPMSIEATVAHLSYC